MALEKGNRTTLLNQNTGVVQPSYSQFGAALQKMGETAFKINQFQAEIMDEEYKTNFKTDVEKFYSEINEKYLNSPNPDMSAMKTEITSYRNKLLEEAPKRFDNYISNYVDQRSLDSFNKVKSYAEKLLNKKASDNILKNENLITGLAFEKTQDILNDDSLSLENKQIALTAVMATLTPHITDYSKQLSVYSKQNPLEFSEYDQELKTNKLLSGLESLLYGSQIEALAESVNWSDQESIDLFEKQYGQYRQDYIDGKIVRSKKNMTSEEINNAIEVGDEIVKNIKNIKTTEIDFAERNNNLKKQNDITTFKNLVNGYNSKSIAFQSTLTSQVVDQFELQYETGNNELLTKAKNLNKVYEFLGGQGRNLNAANYGVLYSTLEEEGINPFKNIDEFKSYMKNYKVHKAEIVDEYMKEESYTPETFFNEYLKLPEEQSNTTKAHLEVLKEGEVPDFVKDDFKQVQFITTKSEIDQNDSNILLDKYQFYKYINGENPDINGKFDVKDIEFFVYLDSLGGIPTTEAIGMPELVRMFQKNNDVKRNNKDAYEKYINGILNDSDFYNGINDYLAVQIADDVANVRGINVGWTDLWNSFNGNPNTDLSRENPFKEYIVPKGERNFEDLGGLTKAILGISGEFATVADAVLPGDFFKTKFADFFLDIDPTVKADLLQFIKTSLPQYVDVGLYNPDSDNNDVFKTQMAEAIPKITYQYLTSLSNKGYSVSSLADRNGQGKLVKFGVENELAKLGYSGEDSYRYLAVQIKTLLGGYEQSDVIDGLDRDVWLSENMPFLYMDKGEFRLPTIENIMEALSNNEFNIKTIEGKNQPEYKIYTNSPNSLLNEMPLGAFGDEVLTLDAPDIGMRPGETPILLPQVYEKYLDKYVASQDNLLSNLPVKVQKEIYRFLQFGVYGSRSLSDAVLGFVEEKLEGNPIFELLGGVNISNMVEKDYDWKSIKELHDQFMEQSQLDYITTMSKDSN